MKIAIICSPGFNDLNCVDETIMQWMTDKDLWLVSVICGKPESVGSQWGQLRGAPIIFSGVWEADFIFAFDTGVDYSVKNFVSQMKNKGKHGRYIQIS